MTSAEEFRAQLERYLWEATQWQGDSVLIDTIIGTVDQYARNLAATFAEDDEDPADIVRRFTTSTRGGVTAPAADASTWDNVDFDALIEDLDEPAQPVPELVGLFTKGPRVIAVTPTPEVPEIVIDISYRRTCRRCDMPKTPEEFHRDRQNADGRRNICKECDNEAKREWKRRRDEQLAAADHDDGTPGDHPRSGASPG
jgi:hypothetical protein